MPWRMKLKYFIPIIKDLMKSNKVKSVFVIAGTIILISFAMLIMAATEAQSTEIDMLPFPHNVLLQGDSIVRKGKGKDKPKPSINSTDFLHAGADEKYPHEGYDNNGWSLRGYMSSYEMAGKHCTSHDALVRFELHKMRVKRDFVDSMADKVIDICNGTSVPPSIVCAQAIIETNFGTSRLKYLANNMFGHMYKGNINKPGIVGKIKAFDKNVNGNIKEYNFRVYSSVWWSMKHHIELLEGNYKEARVMQDITEREQWMGALCKCKTSEMLARDSKRSSYLYAGACAWEAKDGKTSRYVAELRFIIKLYNLEKLDAKWQKEK